MVDIKQSNDSHINVKNITLFYEDINSPTSIKRSIKEMFELNELQSHAFDTFTQINSKKIKLQYVGGVARIKKTQNIKAIQNYYIKQRLKNKIVLQHI